MIRVTRWVYFKKHRVRPTV